MKSMHSLLDEAEESWRLKVQRDFPLYQNMPVLRRDDNEEEGDRDWTFKTDLKRIYALIYDDENLQKKFTSVIPEFWAGEPEEIARDTLEYLLFHELYHPVEAPFSISGIDNDSKKIHQAIRRGLLKGNPDLSPKEQLSKVMGSQNAVKDFILDNRLAIDNKKQGYVPGDVVNTWHLLELHGEQPETDLYTITRVMYGELYGPKSAYRLFEEKAKDKGVNVAEQAFKNLLKRDIELPRQHKTVSGEQTEGYDSDEEAGNYELTEEIRKIFSGEDRYGGIERIMSVLGPYVKEEMPKGRNDLDEDSGGSPQNILQDLFDDMTPEEQAEFTDGLAGEGQSEKMPGIDLYSMHEFYKRNHPQVNIMGGKQVARSAVVGKKEYWKRTKSIVITEDKINKLNLGKIARFQRKTRLPMLVSLDNGLYRVNEYELRERNIKDIIYSDASIDTPDSVEFYVDSSGSMLSYGGNEMGFNDGSRWDMLCNVLYGFAEALHQGSKINKKTCLMRLHNVADRQVDSKIAPVEKFLEGDMDMITKLFKPNNGYAHENLNILPEYDGLKRAYVVVTDGNLILDGRTERESAKMKEIARDSNNTVMLFEIGGTYDLGEAVRSDSAIHYYPVHDKEKMLHYGLNVLLSK